MLQRKHIRAPATFHPGPGLPRERLAYMSDAEMEMLRQMTDGTVNAGPHGIPSFAVTSGTTSGTTMGGGERTSSNPSGGGPGGPFGANSGPSSSTASAAKSTGSGGQGSGSSPNSSSKSPSGPSGPNSGASSAKPAGGVSAPSASTSAPASRSPSGGSLQAPARTAPSSAPSSMGMGGQGPGGGSLQAPNRTAPSGPASPMGGQGSTFSTPAAATRANQATAAATKGGLNPSGSSRTASAMAGANTGRYPGQGTTPLTGGPAGEFGPDRMAPNVGTDFNATLRREAQDIGQPNAYVDNSLPHFNDWATESFGRFAGMDPKVAENWTRTVAGEAGLEGLLGQAAVAKVMENRLKYGQEYGRTNFGAGDPSQVPVGFDANGMRYAASGGKSGTKANDAYKQATPDSPQYGRAAAAMADSLDPYGSLASERPDVLNATHYATPKALETASWSDSPSWAQTATPLGGHVFGNPENTVDKVAALNQQGMPAAAARTQAYRASSPAPFNGAMEPASYHMSNGTMTDARAQAQPAAPSYDQYELGQGGIYNALKSVPGAISGLLGSLNTAPLKTALSDPNIKHIAGMLGSSNPLVSGAAKAAAGAYVGPSIKGAVSNGIQSLKDTFDPNNSQAERVPNYGPGTGSAPSRTETAGQVRDDQRTEQHRTASGTSSSRKGGRGDQGKGGDRDGKRETAAQKAQRIGAKRIEDLAKREPAPAPQDDWSSYMNPMTREQAMRKLLGEEWYT